MKKNRKIKLSNYEILDFLTLLTGCGVLIIDNFKRNFLYVSPNIADLYGVRTERTKTEGCEIYKKHVPDKDFNIVYKGLDVMEKNKHVVHCGCMVFPTEESYYVSQFLNDTIYEVCKKNLTDIKIKYILDYSEKKAANDNNISMTDKFYNGSCVMENSKSQIFTFWSPRHGMCHVIRDKVTGKTIGGTHINFNLNITPEYFDKLLTVHNDYFVSYIPSYKGMHNDNPAISESDNQKLANRDEEDNGVLAFFKFKEIK